LNKTFIVIDVQYTFLPPKLNIPKGFFDNVFMLFGDVFKQRRHYEQDITSIQKFEFWPDHCMVGKQQ
jgi:nicotinamidase-related amidase